MLSDEDLLSRLTNFEDHFVERKSSGDSKDWRKTVVAFANSLPIGYPGVLFIGVKNDGTIEGNANLDSLQKKFSEIIEDVYPTPYYLPRVLSKDGKQFLAVIVPGSEARPHFAGRAYVRDGSRTIEASAKSFEELITHRNSKAYKILEWKEKEVTIALPSQAVNDRPAKLGMTVLECNQFYVTLNTGDSNIRSIPLVDIELSSDHTPNGERLMLVLDRTRW